MSTLAEYLKTSETTATAFAQQVGLSRVSVSRIVNGTQWPSRDTARAIYKESGGAVTEFGVFDAEPNGEAA